jgi:hypothetical protein
MQVRNASISEFGRPCIKPGLETSNYFDALTHLAIYRVGREMPFCDLDQITIAVSLVARQRGLKQKTSICVRQSS